MLSEFTGMFADLGRGVRGLGRLIDDPLDNFLGRRELRQVKKYLDQLDEQEWEALPQVLDAEWYAKRIVECIRHVFV